MSRTRIASSCVVLVAIALGLIATVLSSCQSVTGGVMPFSESQWHADNKEAEKVYYEAMKSSQRWVHIPITESMELQPLSVNNPDVKPGDDTCTVYSHGQFARLGYTSDGNRIVVLYSNTAERLKGECLDGTLAIIAVDRN